MVNFLKKPLSFVVGLSRFEKKHSLFPGIFPRVIHLYILLTVYGMHTPYTRLQQYMIVYTMHMYAPYTTTYIIYTGL